VKTLKWEEGDFEPKTVLNSANDDSCGIDGATKRKQNV
jgi:hypothetical protein